MSAALVLGGGASLWDDVAAALEVGEFAGVLACNDAAVAWPGPVAAGVSYHAEQWPLWMERRRRAGREHPARLFGHREFTQSILARPDLPIEYVEPRFPGQVETGSSGLFALKVALVDLGFDKAVVCGMPMDPRPHFFDGAKWEAYSAHRRGWTEALPQIRARARSMSGWTSQLLGAPDADWLAATTPEFCDP